MSEWINESMSEGVNEWRKEGMNVQTMYEWKKVSSRPITAASTH